MQVKKDFVRIPSDSIEYFVPKHILDGPVLSGASVKLAGYSRLTKGYYISRPSHRGFHVLFATLSGSGKFVMEDGREIVLHQNDMLFSHADGEGHIIQQTTSDEIWEVCWIHVNVDSTWLIPPCSDYAVYQWRNIGKLKACIIGISDEEAHSDTNSTQIQEAYAQLLLAYVGRELASKEHYDYHELMMERLWNQVSSSLWKVWTLDELADAMALSKAHFSRLCFQYYHVSPGKKVKQMKMESALFLLQNTQSPIANVALLCGYTTQASFSAAFSQHYGISPRKARKNVFPVHRNSKALDVMETQHYIIGENAISQTVPLYRSTWEKEYGPLLVADESSWNVAGRRIWNDFQTVGIPVRTVLMPAIPTRGATREALVPILHDLQNSGYAAIVVGSRALVSLVKWASLLCNKPYMEVLTDASTDEYTSCGADVVLNGHPGTLAVHGPYAVIADTTVLKNASPESMASGYVLLAAQAIVGSDWILADTLNIRKLQQDFWAQIQVPVRKLLKTPKAFLGSKQKSGELIGCLMNIGFARQSMHNADFARGEAFYLAKALEMTLPSAQLSSVAPGSLASIATLAMFASIEQLTRYCDPRPSCDPNEGPFCSWERCEAHIHAIFGKHTSPSIIENAKRKFLTQEKKRERQRKAFASWSVILDSLKQQMIPFGIMEQRFSSLGCPTQPLEIGMTQKQMENALYGCYFLTEQYGTLDLLCDLDLLDKHIQLVAGEHWFSRYALPQ